MVHRRNRAVVLVVVSVILIGLGVLLFTVDVGKASQYAGVGSFLVGLLTASMSAVLFLKAIRTPPEPRQETPVHEQDDASSKGSATDRLTYYGPKVVNNDIRNCELVQPGDGANATVFQVVTRETKSS